MPIFWPSTHPSSRSLCRNASSRDGLSEGDVRLSKPIRGTFPTCCASAASGAARRLTTRTATGATPLIIMPPPLCEAPSPSAAPQQRTTKRKGRARRRGHRDTLGHWPSDWRTCESLTLHAASAISPSFSLSVCAANERVERRRGSTNWLQQADRRPLERRVRPQRDEC